MRIRRAIVPVVLTLGAVGSILAGSAASVVAAQATPVAAAPSIVYHT
jgi:hypothetical protein